MTLSAFKLLHNAYIHDTLLCWNNSELLEHSSRPNVSGLGAIFSAKIFPTLQKKLFMVSTMDLSSLVVSSPSLRALMFVVFDPLFITWFIVSQVSLILPSQERSLFVRHISFSTIGLNCLLCISSACRHSLKARS